MEEGKSGSCKLLLLVMEMETSSGFRLEKAVCNHGFFMMAPNRWIPGTKSLIRPLRLASDSHTSVTVSISQSSSLVLRLEVFHDRKLVLSSQDRDAILVRRMLRISERDEAIMEEFHKVSQEAKQRGFGRLFRSPTLFEDMVKSILLCNCTWARSLQMAQALCDLQLKLSSYSAERKLILNYSSKRKRDDMIAMARERQGNFPSPKELASVSETTLNEHCNLGYRAVHILGLARKLESGSLKLTAFEELPEGNYDKLYARLLNLKGFGPFACANIMMCIGFYQKIPEDTETIKHLKEVHGIINPTKRGSSASQVYKKYEPFQCLAYWMERVVYYEKRFGKLSEMPSSFYGNVTGGSS